MMEEKSYGQQNPLRGQERNKRDILRSTKKAWIPLDEQLPPLLLEDSKQETVQQWLDSLFIPVNENFQQVIDHTVTSKEQGIVQMTVKDYMRSLHQFSETPTLSRGTSFNSCYSAVSIPQSIPEWLDFWEKDPVEILLDLGFGTDEPDICTQIPARFLGCGSAARGINFHVFLEAQKQRMDIENPTLYGRFQQVKLLDHVANAFSSLLDDVNILQNKTEEENGEKNVERASVNGTNKHQKRMGELLRRVSKQNIRRDCSPEALKSSKMRSTPSITSAKPAVCGVELSTLANNCDQGPRTASTEHMSPQVSDGLVPSHPPHVFLSKQWSHSSMLAKQALPFCVSDRPVKERSRKENLLKMNKFRNLSCYGDKAQDSFEMEEVQSFEEETCNSLDMTPGTVGATVNRTNSYQSDSSGFLEEPLEQTSLQVLSSSYSQSSAEKDHGKPLDQSPSWESSQPESDESDSKSLVSTSFSSQDWSALEEKASASLAEKGSPFETISRQPESVPADTLQECLGTDLHSQQQCAVALAVKEVLVGTTPGHRSSFPLAVQEAYNADTEGDLLKPETTPKGHMQSWHCASPRQPEMDHHQDRCLQVGPGLPRSKESDQFCSEITNPSPTRENPPPYTGKLSEVMSSTGDLIHTPAKSTSCLDALAGRTPQAKPMCDSLGQIPTRAEAEMENLAPNADPDADSSKSVAIQLPSSLSEAHSVSTLEMDLRRASLEFPGLDPVTASDQGLGTRKRQVSDASIQTCMRECRLWHCCAVLGNKGSPHKAQPLTKSVSLDTGFSSISSAGISPVTAAYGCFCCHLYPHCHSKRESPQPVFSACRHCSCSRIHHQEDQFRMTLQALQQTAMRELCSCTVHEMEMMKKICQSFREHLEEIEQHLAGQQMLFSRDMSEEERKEAKELQALREALRQQVEELEFQLGDRARQIREGILLFELLIEDNPDHNTNPHQCDWTEEQSDLALVSKPTQS